MSDSSDSTDYLPSRIRVKTIDVSGSAGASPSQLEDTLAEIPMPDIARTESIRRHIWQTFAKLGCHADVPPSETIMIRGGHYCGHRFECSGMRAVWFLEEDQIKFFAPDGSLLKVDTPSDAVASDQTRAA